jgi:hypothetical protein
MDGALAALILEVAINGFARGPDAEGRTLVDTVVKVKIDF